MPSIALPLGGIAALLAMCVCAGCGDGSEPDSTSAADDVPAPPPDAFRATVERVIDGDTFVARRDGGSSRVRLIGIDAPESVQPEAPLECFGPEAGAALRGLLTRGTVVHAAYQAGGPVDQFGRQLWDVWLEDGRFVQAELVRQGAVEARVYRPHDQHADVLDRLEEEARDDDAGLHGACS
jgi:micrococcal nuclease